MQNLNAETISSVIFDVVFDFLFGGWPTDYYENGRNRKIILCIYLDTQQTFLGLSRVWIRTFGLRKPGL